VQVTASVDPVTGKVQSLDITQTRIGDTWTETTHFVFVNVPMISYYGTLPYVTMQCGVDGEATCSSITQYTDTTEAESGSWVVTGYGCAPDHDSGYISSLDIFFQSFK
jgi:hypothetical protein